MTEPIDATIRGIGVRAPWSSVPPAVVAAVGEAVGSRVVGAADRAGGFSPGPAALLELADGRAVFAKAADSALQAGGARIHEREATIAAWLPPSVPAPRLLASLRDGGWVVVVFEAVDGAMPSLPWRDADLERVLMLADEVASVTPDGDAPLARAVDDSSALFPCWAEASATTPPGLDGWSTAHLGVLCDWAGRAATATVGTSLVHGDLRADNVLLTGEGAVLVDWPHASIGAPWLDLALAAPSIAMQGGPDPEDLVARSPLLRAADPDALTAVVVGAAGYFTVRALDPPPPGLPTLRPFQAAQGIVARRWAAQRLELPSP